MNTGSRPIIDRVSDWFWAVIHDAQQNTERLLSILSKRSEADLERFYRDYWLVTYELHPDQYEEDRDLDENDIWLSSAWVVNHGRELYEIVSNEPKLIPNPNTIVHLKWLDCVDDLCHEMYGHYIQR